MCVAEDTHRNIWIGTRQGLFRYNAPDNSFTRFTVADGLPNDFVYGILEDELARLWISTNNGLACFDTQKNTFRRYSLCDGIANNQFNIYSYCRSRDGVFWFGGIGGITCAQDVLEFILVGAYAVEVGTMNFVRPDAAFRIAEELPHLCQQLGIKNLAEFRGTLQL